MKVAVVWYHGSPLSQCSFRFEEYVSGLQRLGHEAVVVCPPESDDGFEVAKVTAPSTAAMTEPTFWTELAADVAIIATFHQMSALLEAVRAAGTRIIALGDSDGQVGVRAFPRATLTNTVFNQKADGWASAKRGLSFARKYVRAFRRADPQDEEFLRSTRLSDVVVLGNEESRGHFRRFLDREGAADERDKVIVSPLAIGEIYCSYEPIEPKRDLIVAIGRWDAPQKDAGLLRDALRRYLSVREGAEVALFGVGGEPFFGALSERFAGVQYRGPQPPQVIAPVLATSRSIVFSSRWEGSPHAGSEALCLGATLIGTPIPSLRSWAARGRFGTIATDRSPRALAKALLREADLWDRGDRDPRTIADHWRPRVSGEAFCRTVLDGLEQVQSRYVDSPSAPRLASAE